MKETLVRHTQADWDLFFYGLAEQASTRSKDVNRKVGAVIASAVRRQVSFGYNGFPPEIPDTLERVHDRRFALANTIHAEDNCLRQLPFDPRGGSLYVTRFPCLDCANKIIRSGVTRVIAPAFDPTHHRWGPSWTTSAFQMQTAGVTLVLLEELLQ